MENPQTHILYIPAWYPNDQDEQNGSFIRKQAMAAATCSKISVLYLKSAKIARTDLLQENNFTELTIYYQKPKFIALAAILYFVAAFSGYRKILKLAGKPDLIHIAVPAANTLPALFIGWMFRIPYIVSEHWSGFLDGRFQAMDTRKREFLKGVYEKSKAVLVVSKTLENAMREAGIKARYRRVPNIIEKTTRDIIPKPDQFLVLADLDDSIKNISGIIKAFAEISPHYPQAELLVAGGGTDEITLKKLAGEYNGDRISFAGRVGPNMALYLIAEAGCVVVNSRYETFSMVAAEALAAGRPLICTRCGGPEEFLDDDTAILIPTDDHNSLVKSMKNYLEGKFSHQPELQKKKAATFSPEVIASQLCNIFKNAAEKNR